MRPELKSCDFWKRPQHFNLFIQKQALILVLFLFNEHASSIVT